MPYFLGKIYKFIALAIIFISLYIRSWGIHGKFSEKIDFYSGTGKLILHQMAFKGKVPQAHIVNAVANG